MRKSTIHVCSQVKCTHAPDVLLLTEKQRKQYLKKYSAFKAKFSCSFNDLKEQFK